MSFMSWRGGTSFELCKNDDYSRLSPSSYNLQREIKKVLLEAGLLEILC